jgi:flagellar hook-associated protein 2
MATTITSAANQAALNNLATTFRTQITTIMTAERKPVERVQTQRDQVDVRRGIYTDLKKNLDELQSSLKALISTDDAFTATPGVKPTVTPGTAGSTVLTATTETTSLAANYDFVVTQLAKAQSKASTTFSSADIALGKSGTFWMGGTGTASASLTATDSVTAATTGSIADGQHELGTGAYSVEVRDTGTTRQFRLVDADGNAVSISNTEGTAFTSGWQTMTDGTFDTRRGLSLAMNSEGALGSTAVSYTAKGVSINISASDTLRNIASNINAASQPLGSDFRASVVGKQLVITGNNTGENHGMIFTDGAGLGFGADLQKAQNALFTVNGMSLSRANNTNLTDVVDGATISLNSDAEGKSARLSIGADNSKVIAAMNSMVSKYNAAFSYLTSKTTVSSTSNGNSTTYTRGALSGDLVFRGLRLDMLNKMNRSYPNSGSLKHLEEIGLSFDKDLKLNLDASKFEAAYKSSPSDVTALLDSVMGGMEKMVSTYTGTSGSLQRNVNSMDDQIKQLDQRIERHNATLLVREASLISQYQQMQTLLADYGRQAQELGIDISA